MALFAGHVVVSVVVVLLANVNLSFGMQALPKVNLPFIWILQVQRKSWPSRDSVSATALFPQLTSLTHPLRVNPALQCPVSQLIP